MSYTLMSGIILISLYLPYKLLLAGEKQHRLNRVVLLLIYVLAIIMPLLKPVGFPGSAGDELNVGVGDVAGIEFGPLVGGLVEETEPLWSRIMLWVYAVGVGLMACRFIWSAIKLAFIVIKGERIDKGAYTLVVTGDNTLSPFSWMHYIVVGDEEDAGEGCAVMIHEERHVRACHYIDLLLAQLYAILVWYNPVSWLMIDELKTVHEYEADEAVIDSGVNLKEYQMLLIKKAVGARLPSLANSLNHSKLQKRITMMYQSRSRMAGKFGSLALIPALAIGMAAVSIPAVASFIDDASQATLVNVADKGNKKSAPVEMVEAIDVKKELASPSVREPEETVEVSEENVAKDDVVTPAQKVEDMTVPSESGMESGTAAAVENETAVSIGSEEKKTEEKEVYTACDKQAEFPGGFAELMKWLSYNIKYPKDAQKDGIQGRVIVKFVINKDGSVSDATILKGVAPSLDKEALRVVSAMPKWIPGEANGKIVASWFNLPIVFKLGKSNSDNGKKDSQIDSVNK